MDLFNLSAKITLDSSEYDRGIDSASKKGSSFASSLGSSFSSFGSAASKVFSAVSTGFNAISSVGGVALKGITVAAAAGGAALGVFAKSAIDAGSQFDSSMSQVAATMGYTVEELNTQGSAASNTFNQLRDFAMEMGASTAFSASQAADALNYMALAGYSAEDSMTMLPNVLNLAAAGSMDLAAASDMVTDSQTALGLSFEQTNTLVDQMAKTASTTNTSVTQLGEAILTVGGTAKSLAGGTNELNAVLGVMADNGIKGAEAGTHLRNIMLAMTPTTSDAVAAFEQLGLQTYDTEGNLRNLNDIFLDLNAAMDGMTSAEKTDILNKIFNKTDLTTVNALLGTTAERWDEVYAAIENAEGAAGAMANVQLDNLNGDVTLFKSALEGAQILISDQLTPSLRNFVQFGTEGIGRLSSAFQSGGFSGLLNEAVTMLGEITDAVTAAIPEMAAKGVEIVTKLVTSISQTIGSRTGQLAEAGKAVIDALATGFSTIVNAALPIIQDLIPTIVQGIATYQSTLFNVGLDIITAIVTGISDNIDSVLSTGVEFINSILQGISENLPALIAGAQNIIMSFMTVLTEELPNLLQSGLEIIMTLVQGISESLPELIPAIVGVVTQINVFLIENIPLLLDAAFQLLVGLGEGIINSIPVLGEAATQVITGLGDSMLAAFPALESVWNGLKTGFQSAWNMIKSIWDTVSPYFKSIWDSIRTIYSVVANILGGFFNSAWSTIKGIWDAVSPYFSALWSAIRATFSVAESVLGAFFSAAWSAILAVWDAAAGYFAAIWASIAAVFQAVEAVLSGDFQAAWTAIQNLVNTWVSYFQGIWENIQSVFSNAGSAFASIGSNIVAGLKQGIAAAWGSLTSWVYEKFQALVSSVKSGLGIASPSKVFAGIGGFMVAGLEQGWERNFGDVERTITKDMDFSGVGPNLSLQYGGNFGLNGSGFGASTATGGTSNAFGNIYININGIDFEDMHELAVYCAQEMQSMTDRRSMTFA